MGEVTATVYIDMRHAEDPPQVFFSFDGIDGAGKSTQLTLFGDWLRELGHDVEICRDPGSTELGEAVREILLGADYRIDNRAEMLLYMACRAQLVQEVIQPALSTGKTVISDRFVLANVVYQGSGGDLTADEIWRVGEIATQGLLPDLTFILDVTPDAAASRLPAQRDRLERRGPDYFHAVRQAFLQQAARHPTQIVVVDAAGDIDVIQTRVREAAQTLLGLPTTD